MRQRWSRVIFCLALSSTIFLSSCGPVSKSCENCHSLETDALQDCLKRPGNTTESCEALTERLSALCSDVCSMTNDVTTTP
jgi:hypothetical protein